MFRYNYDTFEAATGQLRLPLRPDCKEERRNAKRGVEWILEKRFIREATYRTTRGVGFSPSRFNRYERIRTYICETKTRIILQVEERRLYKLN